MQISLIFINEQKEYLHTIISILINILNHSLHTNHMETKNPPRHLKHKIFQATH